ncbi:MAG: hypothetical protein IPQ08_06415 [Chitinophagaceae bacterium]|nr:hypothetical protein [Chitinophagaceae bacterium]
MRQNRILRKVATVPVTAGGFATLDLPRDYDYETIFVRINGGLQVTAGATSVRAEAPVQIIPRLEVIADGKNNLYSAPFWFAALANYERRGISQGARAVTPPSGVAIATYQVEANGTIDLMSQGAVRPKDSNFRSAGLSLFQLRMTFGQPGDCFVGGTVVFNNMFVDVYVQQMVEIPDSTGAITTPIALKKISYQELALLSSNANQDIRLPAGNNIKSVVMRTDGSTTAGEPSVAVLNNVILGAGVDVRLNLSGAQLRAKNNQDYGLLTAGYYIADLTSKGDAPINLTDLWDVTGAAEPKLTLDVTGGANVKMQAVVTEYILAGQVS